MIFLSYASEDRARVLPYYDLLDNHGFDPWMDCKKILGGQNWDYEIKTALDRSDLVAAFVSSNSVDKRGYAQREIKAAIDKYEEKLVGDIYIIPVQLDDGDFPHLLKGIQFIRASSEGSQDQLLKSVEAARKQTRKEAESAQSEAEVRWSIAEAQSSYSGIPGYSTNIGKIAVSSSKYANVRDISDHINGTLIGLSMEARASSLTPDPTLYNLMQDEWRRTNTFDAIFMSATVVGRLISITYSLHWYNAGAAHPVHSPKVFNYFLEPVFYIASIKSIFRSEEALAILQSAVRQSLATQLCSEQDQMADLDWIHRGTASWDDFSHFTFDASGMVFHFSSYQVACYAAGMPSATVPYSVLTPVFNDSVLYALNLYRPA